MIRRCFTDIIRTCPAQLINRIQIMCTFFQQHRNKFLKNFSRCLRIIYRTMMVFQRYTDCLCHMIQCKLGKLWQQHSCHGKRIHMSICIRQLQFPRIFLNKTGIKRSIVRYQYTAFAKGKKLRQNLIDRRCIHDICIRDRRQLGDPVRNRLLWVYIS